MNTQAPGGGAALRAVIFDLDGLLIDSEPVWKEVEIELLGALGVPLTWEMTHQTMGMRMVEVAAFWRARYPWDGPDEETVAAQVTDEVIRRLCASGRAMPGAGQAIAAVRAAGLPAAVATSSPLRLARSVLEGLGLASDFSEIVSAEHEQYGKPHPAVFLTTALRLGVEPGDCLVLEDSLNGVIAARAARMHCFAIPSAELASDPRYVLADRILTSLMEFPAQLEILRAAAQQA